MMLMFSDNAVVIPTKGSTQLQAAAVRFKIIPKACVILMSQVHYLQRTECDMFFTQGQTHKYPTSV